MRSAERRVNPVLFYATGDRWDRILAQPEAVAYQICNEDRVNRDHERDADMRFKSVTIKEFRRFKHLTVLGIPQKARLIMLAGPNGCGKSCFFDALNTWYNWKAKKNRSWEMDYHGKAGSPLRSQFRDDVNLVSENSLKKPALLRRQPGRSRAVRRRRVGRSTLL